MAFSYNFSWLRAASEGYRPFRHAMVASWHGSWGCNKYGAFWNKRPSGDMAIHVLCLASDTQIFLVFTAASSSVPFPLCWGRASSGSLASCFHCDTASSNGFLDVLGGAYQPTVRGELGLRESPGSILSNGKIVTFINYLLTIYFYTQCFYCMNRAHGVTISKDEVSN